MVIRIWSIWWPSVVVSVTCLLYVPIEDINRRIGHVSARFAFAACPPRLARNARTYETALPRTARRLSRRSSITTWRSSTREGESGGPALRSRRLTAWTSIGRRRPKSARPSPRTCESYRACVGACKTRTGAKAQGRHGARSRDLQLSATPLESSSHDALPDQDGAAGQAPCRGVPVSQDQGKNPRQVAVVHSDHRETDRQSVVEAGADHRQRLAVRVGCERC
jgi:hypothetical protein